MSQTQEADKQVKLQEKYQSILQLNNYPAVQVSYFIFDILNYCTINAIIKPNLTVYTQPLFFSLTIYKLQILNSLYYKAN